MFGYQTYLQVHRYLSTCLPSSSVHTPSGQLSWIDNTSPSPQSLPLDLHSHQLSTHSLSCSPSTQPCRKAIILHLYNHASLSQGSSTYAAVRFLVSLSTKTLPAPTPHSPSRVPRLRSPLCLTLCSGSRLSQLPIQAAEP